MLRDLLSDLRGTAGWWGVFGTTVTLEQLTGKPMASLRVSPPQEPPHKQGVGGTAGAWSQEEGNISEQPTEGLQVMHSLSSLFLTLFICVLLLNLGWDR